MTETLKSLILNQLGASLDTLGYCIETCPKSDWQQAHNDAPFSQVVFHTLFYADLYLGRDALPFKEQPFHAAHKSTFGSYEEMEDKVPEQLYEKPFCLSYLTHCRAKLKTMVEAETAESLAGDSGIAFRKISRVELYVYNLRHIQHHAAQLGLRIQMLTGKEMPWFSGKKTAS